VNLIISEPEIPDIEDIYIDGDRHKLGQVIRNLLSNALKFTPAGGSVTVKTTLVSLPELVPNPMNGNSQRSHNHQTSPYKPVVAPDLQLWIRLEITDSGAGISLVRISMLNMLCLLARYDILAGESETTVQRSSAIPCCEAARGSRLRIRTHECVFCVRTDVS